MKYEGEIEFQLTSEQNRDGASITLLIKHHINSLAIATPEYSPRFCTIRSGCIEAPHDSGLSLHLPLSVSSWPLLRFPGYWLVSRAVNYVVPTRKGYRSASMFQTILAPDYTRVPHINFTHRQSQCGSSKLYGVVKLNLNIEDAKRCCTTIIRHVVPVRKKYSG